MWRLLLFLIISTLSRADGRESIYRWPPGYAGKQKLVVSKLDSSGEGAYGFESEGFRFYADAEIPSKDWRSIMIVCEGLRGAMRSLPLDLVRPDTASPTRRRVVRIFKEESDYHDAGGLPATVGTYRPRSGDVLIWMRGLNEPDPEQGTFRLAKARQYDLLVHELSHQATGREFRRLPVWFSEALAEYLAAAHDSPGIYSFKDPTTAIRTHVKKYLGDHAKQNRFKIVPLRTLTALDGWAWSENTRSGTGYEPFLKYVSSLLLFHYFCHLDPERNHGEVVRNYVGAIRAGRPASRAMVEELLRGRSLGQIEAEIEKYWQPKGLRVEFGE